MEAISGERLMSILKSSCSLFLLECNSNASMVPLSSFTSDYYTDKIEGDMLETHTPCLAHSPTLSTCALMAGPNGAEHLVDTLNITEETSEATVSHPLYMHTLSPQAIAEPRFCPDEVAKWGCEATASKARITRGKRSIQSTSKINVSSTQFLMEVAAALQADSVLEGFEDVAFECVDSNVTSMVLDGKVRLISDQRCDTSNFARQSSARTSFITTASDGEILSCVEELQSGGETGCNSPLSGLEENLHVIQLGSEDALDEGGRGCASEGINSVAFATYTTEMSDLSAPDDATTSIDSHSIQSYEESARVLNSGKLVNVQFCSPDADGVFPPNVHLPSRIDCSKLCNLNMSVLEPFPSAVDQCVAMGRIMLGKWETLLTRSDPLEPLFKNFGIAYFKRVIVDKLAIPLTVQLEDNDMSLHVIVHLPVGNRHMRWRLDGVVSSEDDPDCGIWEGQTFKTSHSIPWLADGKPFAALQQVRTHPKIGMVHETRAVLPDATHGRVLYLNYTLFPRKNPKDKIEVVRILKPIK